MKHLLELRQAVLQLIKKHPQERIIRFTHNGNIYWLKNFAIRERKDFLKSGTRRAMLREIRMLRKLKRLGVPVPPMLLAIKSHLVLGDVGMTLNRILPDANVSQRTLLLQLAAQALAQLHQQNLIHGRPALRDLAYDNHRIYFLDFESTPFTRNLEHSKAWDLFFFINSIFRERYLEIEDAHQALLAYMSGSPTANTTALHLREILQQYRIIYQIMRHIPCKGKDYKAFLGVFRLLCKEKFIFHSK